MKRGLIALFLTIILTYPSTAQEFARRAAVDKKQAQLSVCEAFYTIVGRCPDVGDWARKLEVARKLSYATADMIKMSKADIDLRLELNIVIQRSLIADSCKNIGTLRMRYSAECAQLVAE